MSSVNHSWLETELDSTQSYYHYLLSFKPLLFSSLSFLFDQFAFSADYSVRSLPRGHLTSEAFLVFFFAYVLLQRMNYHRKKKEDEEKSKISQYIHDDCGCRDAKCSIAQLYIIKLTSCKSLFSIFCGRQDSNSLSWNWKDNEKLITAWVSIK